MQMLLLQTAVIKSASCSITSVFYLTVYYDARKHKIKIYQTFTYTRVPTTIKYKAAVQNEPCSYDRFGP